ncbi:MAG: stage III sporulation protein AA [Clostridiales bacterium]|nr:stage III sporulation protein AA [Clostridiales bacterium]
MREEADLLETRPGGAQRLLPYLPPFLRNALGQAPPALLAALEEIRLRQGAPVLLRCGREEWFLAARGGAVKEREAALIPGAQEMRESILAISQSSFYALEEELKRGFITLPGGHRAGLAGKAVLENGAVKTLKEISGINFRVARHVPRAAGRLLPLLFTAAGAGLPAHTLIVSPPGCGKTTVLRDLAFSLSEGGRWGRGLQVGVVDERSELAAMLNGQPQLPIGMRTDVLDACPKAEGMMLLIRSMAPQVLICDEIGRAEDAAAILEAARAGIKVIASAHGGGREEMLARPAVGGLIEAGVFERLALYSRSNGPGTLEGVWNGKGERIC